MRDRGGGGSCVFRGYESSICSIGSAVGVAVSEPITDVELAELVKGSEDELRKVFARQRAEIKRLHQQLAMEEQGDDHDSQESD